MNWRRQALALSALLGALLGASELGAQGATGSIAGRVIDSTSSAGIEGVNISVVGTTRGVLTREDGSYTLTGVPTGPRRVRVSRLGFAAQDRLVTVAAGQVATANFALERAAARLSETVVIGYGETRRADVTGSVASVEAGDLQKTAVATLEQGLQGRVPGVQVTQGDAAPGGGMRIQIRGVNSMNAGSAEPLYVIDGVPWVNSGVSKRQIGARSEENLVSLTETNPLAQLAPSEIESIDILKDASATAIYGSRGANGVVIITTKSGRRNRAGQFTLNYNQGYASVVREIPVLDAFDYATYVNTAFINAFGPGVQYPYGGRPGSLSPDSIRKVVGAGTNWQDEIFRTALTQDGQLGFSGGDDVGSYSISGNLLHQAGAITGSEFRRGGLRLNMDRDIRSNFRLSTNLNLSRTVNDMVRSSTISGYRNVGIVRMATTYVPMSFRDTTQSDPRAEDATTWSNYGANPLRYTDEVDERDQQTRGVGGVKGTITLPAGFALDLSVGANYERRSYGVYFPTSVNEGRATGGTAVQSGSEFGNLISENLLRFNREFGQSHRVEAVGGFTLQNDRATWLGQEVQTFPNDILGGNVLQNGTNPQKPNSGLFTSRLASWLGRANYNFGDRYLLTATVRADGSSKFAANHKWAVFPAFAFAWKASEEPFLRDRFGLSDLKLRLSYGKSGNQAIGAYQSLAAVAGTDMTLNEAVVPAYIITQLGNPDLRWETTVQSDLGLDVGLFANRLTATVDVYRKSTNDLLQNITLAGNTGFSSAWINSGEVTNRGIELSLGYDILQGGGRGLGALTWNASVNGSRNINRIENLGPKTQQFAGRLGAGGGLEAAPFIQKPGLPIGAMFGYKTNGVVRNAADSVAESKLQGKAVRVGDFRYLDFNNDGKITTADQYVIGDANADWVAGLTNRFTFGKLDVSALLTGVWGNDIINTERIRYLNLDGTINVPREIYENTFDPTTNPNGTYPQIRQDRKTDSRFHDQFIEDGSFLRLKNVQVGYSLGLPGNRTARVYLNGINLWTKSDYSGFDPEVSAFGSPDRPGVDIGSYPQQRMITFGFTTSF